MICVSVAETGIAACLKRLDSLSFAEVRIDALKEARAGDMPRIFTGEKRMIATCRPGRYSEAARRDLLKSALESGAAYVDIELGTEKSMRRDLLAAAHGRGAELIVSHHDYDRTPLPDRLHKLVDQCFAEGADIAKIACRVRVRRDAARLLGLLDDSRSLVVVGMGEMGRIVRAVAPVLGGVFTYASLEVGMETAPGQPDKSSMERMIDDLTNF